MKGKPKETKENERKLMNAKSNEMNAQSKQNERHMKGNECKMKNDGKFQKMNAT